MEGEKPSCKFLLRTIYRNTNAVTGKNIRNIEIETGFNIDIYNMKHNLDNILNKIWFARIPENELWRINSVKELSQIKSGHLKLEGFSIEEIEDMLQFICVS